MIELERHIEILLLSNDCVIVPNLGGFMAHHVEARYDEEDHSFLPPLRTLGFNPQLKMNDSLLVQSYIEAYDLSYPEALRRIEDEVTELHQYLENKGEYELNDIGVLTMTDDGRLVFTPCEAGILTPELYGLSSFEMNALRQRGKTAEPHIPVEKGTADASEEPSPVAETSEVEEERAITIKMSWVRNAVAVAATILALFLLTTPIGDTENEHRNISNLNNPLIVGMLPKDTNMEKIDIKKAAVTQPVVNADSTILSDTLSTVTEVSDNQSIEDGYCIVLASYVTKKNAQSFVERLHKDGHEEAEVFIRNNVTRVILGNFKTESDAYNTLRTLRDNPGFEEAWVMKLSR